MQRNFGQKLHNCPKLPNKHVGLYCWKFHRENLFQSLWHGCPEIYKVFLIGWHSQSHGHSKSIHPLETLESRVQRSVLPPHTYHHSPTVTISLSQSIHKNADLVDSYIPRNHGSSEGIYANVGRDQEPFMWILGLIVQDNTIDRVLFDSHRSVMKESKEKRLI